jgi:hypothetical protein
MKFFGKATIKVDGDTLETEQGATLDPGGVVRNPKVGDHVFGYTEVPKEAMIEGSVFMSESTSLEKFRQITDATVTFICDTGQVYILKHAWLVEPPVVTGGDTGTVRLKFAAQPAEEVA